MLNTFTNKFVKMNDLQLGYGLCHIYTFEYDARYKYKLQYRHCDC